MDLTPIARIVLVDRTQSPPDSDSPVRYGLAAFSAALAQADVPVARRAHLGKDDGGLVIVVGLTTDQLVRRLLAYAGVEGNFVPETLLYQWCNTGQGQALVIAGVDARGLVYALLEAADQVTYEGIDALRGIANSVESPDHRVRGLDRFIMGPLDDEWFYAETFWTYYLDQLIHARFNRFVLVAGFDTAYLSPPYPYFVETPGYAHVSVRGLDEAGQARNLAQLRHIGRECHRRGLDFFLATWQQTPWTANQTPQVEGLPDDEAVLSGYCAAGLKALLARCPEIDGVQLRVNHESGVGAQESNEAFWLRLIDAVASCGRAVNLDLRAKGLTDGMICHALNQGLALSVPTKYWCEQTGLPHHLTQMRREELTQLGNLNHSRRYSYADLLRKPHWYDMLYRLWTLGSTTLFLWGDPDYVCRFSASCKLGDAAGFEVAAPLSMKGGHASIQGDPWPIFADPSLQSGRWEDERHWLFYLLYGRIGYSAQTPARVWGRVFQRRFGAAAAAIEAGMRAASRILPLVTAFHMPVHPMLHYWPELSTGAALFAEHNHNVHFNRGFYGQVSYGSAEPSDPGLFYGIDEYAHDLHTGQVQGKLTPLQVGDWLAAFAAETRRAVAAADSLMVGNESAEYRSLRLDLNMLADLADHHVHKIRAALALAGYRLSEDGMQLCTALDESTAARSAWADLSAKGRGSYYAPLEFNAGQSRARYGQWQDYLPELDADIARLEEMLSHLSPTASATAEPANAPSTLDAGRFADPPRRWQAGQDLPIYIQCAGIGLATPTLHYRRANQMEGAFHRLPMQRTDEGFVAVIPGEYLQAAWDLLVYVSAVLSPQSVVLYPGLYHPLHPLPYFVIAVEEGTSQRTQRPTV